MQVSEDGGVRMTRAWEHFLRAPCSAPLNSAAGGDKSKRSISKAEISGSRTCRIRTKLEWKGGWHENNGACCFTGRTLFKASGCWPEALIQVFFFTSGPSLKPLLNSPWSMTRKDYSSRVSPTLKSFFPKNQRKKKTSNHGENATTRLLVL